MSQLGTLTSPEAAERAAAGAVLAVPVGSTFGELLADLTSYLESWPDGRP